MFIPALARSQTSIRLDDPWQFGGPLSGLRPCGQTIANYGVETGTRLAPCFEWLNSYQLS